MKKMSAGTRLVLETLRRLGGRERAWTGTIRQLSAEAGVSRATVQRAANELIGAGCLHRSNFATYPPPTWRIRTT